MEHHLICDEKPSRYLDKLCTQLEFKQYPFALLFRLRITEQSPVHHPEGNAWNHTLLVVDEAAKRRNESRDALVFMWAALLHDIGKPITTRVRKGKITAYDHDTAGARLAKDFLSVFTKDQNFIYKVASLVRYHMHILYVVKNLPFADIGGMLRQTDIHEVALLGLCDRLGRADAMQTEEEEQVRFFIRQCIEDINRKDKAMAKAGMRRPDPKDPHGTESNRKTHIPKNTAAPVPEFQGNVKSGKEKAKPILYE
ncbi:hypothetical protein SDC9_41346 [bioreactor metagenome]|uniref:HD domain-containing protein n=1 Tax=bioreactor metagenome TaxID=1076179 RepID=A0A644VV83_9ZZZZ